MAIMRKSAARSTQVPGEFVGPGLARTVEDTNHRYGWQGTTTKRKLFSGIYVDNKGSGYNFPPDVQVRFDGKDVGIVATAVLGAVGSPDQGKVVEVTTNADEIDYEPGVGREPHITITWTDSALQEGEEGNEWHQHIDEITIDDPGEGLLTIPDLTWEMTPPLGNGWIRPPNLEFVLGTGENSGKLVAVNIIPVDQYDDGRGACYGPYTGMPYVPPIPVLSVDLAHDLIPTIIIDNLEQLVSTCVLFPKTSGIITMERKDHHIRKDDPCILWYHDPDLSAQEIWLGDHVNQPVLCMTSSPKIVSVEHVIPNGDTGFDNGSQLETMPPAGTEIWLTLPRSGQATMTSPEAGTGEPGYYSVGGVAEIVIVSQGNYDANQEIELTITGGGYTRIAKAKGYTNAAGNLDRIWLYDQGKGYGDIPLVSAGSGGAVLKASIAACIITGIELTAPGIGFAGEATIEIAPPANGVVATAKLTVRNGQVVLAELLSRGAGYLAAPGYTITGTNGGSGATVTIKTEAVFVFRMCSQDDHPLQVGDECQAVWIDAAGTWDDLSTVMPCGRYELKVATTGCGCVSVYGGIQGPMIGPTTNCEGTYNPNYPAGNPWILFDSDYNATSQWTSPIFLCRGKLLYHVSGVRGAGATQCCFKSPVTPDFVDVKYDGTLLAAEWFSIPVFYDTKMPVSA